MNNWRSYDDVSETYERIHAPRFAEPARDLVALAAPSEGARVLDVGTGTGVTAEAAAALIGSRGVVVGADLSTGMVRTGHRARPSIRLVAASGIDLPFAGGAFDVVVANFVVSHFTNYETGLYEMIRVLRPGGRLALSAWSDLKDELQQAWTEVISEVVPKELLEPVWAETAPWHERFRDRDQVEKTLIGAGLQLIRTEYAEYHFTMSLGDYLEGLEVWGTGRFVRSMLGEEGWSRLIGRAREVFSERFADPLNDFQTAILGVGTKP